MPSVSLPFVFEGDASQTNDVTVFGEDATAITVDKTITVAVSAAKMSAVLSYADTWNPAMDKTPDGSIEQPFPEVKVDLSGLATGLTALGTALKETSAAAGANTFNDDASPAEAIPTLQSRLEDQSFTWTNSILDDAIPAAAVKKIEASGFEADHLYTDILSAAVLDTSAIATETDLKKALKSLFEQAAAAGMMDQTVADRQSTAANGWRPVKFVAGDELALYVKYNLSVSRKYQVDDDVTASGSLQGATLSAITISYGGKTIQVNVLENNETSETETYTYKVKLVTAAADGSFF